MNKEDRFNLIDEPWIPVVEAGRVSLRQLFSKPEYRALGGNPVQKIAVTKLLLAIAQAAATPKDDETWATMGADGMAQSCLDYLGRWYDRFWLYGEHPFLQFPALKGSQLWSDSTLLPDIATGNTTVLTESQVEKPLSNAERALLLVTAVGFALGGKRADQKVVLSPGYTKKRSAHAGALIGVMGYLHSFLQSRTLTKTIWLNLFSQQQIEAMSFYPEGLGTPPWEALPAGEDCPVARRLRESLMGRLVPLSRFFLLQQEGLHCTEGINHLTYKEGGVDPSVAVNNATKVPKALWADAEKRPWRQLTALLSFMGQEGKGHFDCYQLSLGLTRARRHEDRIGVWSGGLRVSRNAGEQYVSGTDDFVESLVLLDSDILGEAWYVQLSHEMKALEEIAKRLYGATFNYYKAQKLEGGEYAATSTNVFWQLAERYFQRLVDACDPEDASANPCRELRKVFATLVNHTYSDFCPRGTARQLIAWAQCRPNLIEYLSQGAST
ncbi:MAG: type I-E CRISPR-associated protein Cse1/CasA [Acidobacteriota bacterium]|nr:type I-E CRISPR-associated protein Cse1/CasA [Acidobacteriota bacterium]